MNREQIDGLFTDPSRFFELCNDKNLIQRYNAIIEETNKTGVTEELEREYYDVIKEIYQNIHSQIPEELLEYYYRKIALEEYPDGMLNDKQIENAVGIYERYVEEILALEEEKRITNFLKLKNFDLRIKIFKSFSPERQLDILDKIENEHERILFAKEITADTTLLNAIDKFKEDRYKEEIALKIRDPEIKLQALDKIATPNIVKSINDFQMRFQALAKLKRIKSEKKMELLKNVSNIDIETILQILDEIEKGKRLPYVQEFICNPKDRIKALRKLCAEERWEIAKNYKHYFGEDSAILSQVTELGEDKINFISAFPEIKQQILNLDANQYDLFVRCINRYLEESESEEWTKIASIFLQRIETGEYNELIADIEGKEIDVGKLCKVIQSPNNFGLVKAEDLERDEVIKREKCDAIINGEGTIDEKKNATLQKLFGVDIEYAELTIDNFGVDIENLPDSDEKDFVFALKAIININDEETLKEIYNECEEVGIVNGLAIRRRLKNVYARMFNDGLYEPKAEDLIEEDLGELQGVSSKVYNAGTNFKMIVSGVSPIIDSETTIDNYKSNWNREYIRSQFFCACYIRNDMLSTAGGKITYGFTQMREDSLIKWNTQDAGSNSERFEIS